MLHNTINFLILSLRFLKKFKLLALKPVICLDFVSKNHMAPSFYSNLFKKKKKKIKKNFNFYSFAQSQFAGEI